MSAAFPFGLAAMMGEVPKFRWPEDARRQEELLKADDFIVEAMRALVVGGPDDPVFAALQQARREVTTELTNLAHRMSKGESQ